MKEECEMVSLRDTSPFFTERDLSFGDLAGALGVSEGDLAQLNEHIESDNFGNVARLLLNVPTNLFEKVSELELVAPPPGPQSPIQWAEREQERHIREFPGRPSNPEVEKYHRATGGVAPDDVPWCSSFVNWCVEQALGNGKGTESKAALSWRRWGGAARDRQRDQAVRGDIVVFKDTQASGRGHVGFFWSREGNRLLVLGGNQSDSVRISNFSESGGRLQVVSYRALS